MIAKIMKQSWWRAAMILLIYLGYGNLNSWRMQKVEAKNNVIPSPSPTTPTVPAIAIPATSSTDCGDNKMSKAPSDFSKDGKCEVPKKQKRKKKNET